MENIKEQLEEVIKKNLPEKKEGSLKISQGNPTDGYSHKTEREKGFNQAISQIDTSLIADEVLKVVGETRRDFIIRILGEQHKNELQGKGYDFYFALRTELDNLSTKENKDNG